MATVQRLAWIGAASGIVMVLAFGWMKEHDKTVAERALNDQKARELVADAKTIQQMRTAIVALGKQLQDQTVEYRKREAVVHDSVESLQNEIDRIAHSIQKMLPDSSKELVTRIVEGCRAQASLIQSQLDKCDSLRTQAMNLSERKDTIIFRLEASRNNYKALYESERSQVRPRGPWSTIGKATVFVSVVAVVTKIFHLW